MNAIDPRCFAASTINTISISGGKDSVAQWLRAIENDVPHISVFADTGHEHPQTMEYLDYLESKLGKVIRVKADFTRQIEGKRKFIAEKWPVSLVQECGMSPDEAAERIHRALEILKPTGSPFLDLCMWKGRFPSTKVGLGETINLAKNAVPATRRVNSKPLTGDITLWASDVGAISADAVGEITDNGTMASANTPGWWRVSVSNSDSVADFPTWPDGSKLYSYGYMFVEKIGEVWFQHYYAHMGANAKRQDWGTVPNTSRPWVIDYNTANKPSAGDVGALPIAGGRLNGPLSIGTDNALGGNSIVLGDNDTGIKQNGDGVLDIYANSAHVLRFISSLVESMASLKVNGNAVATGEVQAGNGSSRMTNNGDIFGSVWGNSWLSIWINNNFVADVQLGAGTSVSTWDKAGSWPNTPGYVVTSVWKDANGINIDGIDYAPLQKRFGNQWYTVQGGTA
ncbi:phosphoadenosine phosphosulfate reductase family protein [Salmonella enterica subsp. diarizonae]|nr:phosphoadenosine phosphosulfate reductase family protein [Salmonella enterica subsp. diarizonae]